MHIKRRGEKSNRFGHIIAPLKSARAFFLRQIKTMEFFVKSNGHGMKSADYFVDVIKKLVMGKPKSDLAPLKH